MKEPARKKEEVAPGANNNWRYNYEVYAEPGEVYYTTSPGFEKEKVKTGKGHIPHGGIIIRDIYNHDYRMGYDIGVIGIYVLPGPQAKADGFTKPKFLILGPPDFIQVDNTTFKPLTQKDVYDSFASGADPDIDALSYNMDVFNEDRTSEVKATFITKSALFGKNSGYLKVTQKFIFTNYDDKPAHEPTGGLKAARVFPIIELSYDRFLKENPVEAYIESFRIDYRLYLNLDTYAISVLTEDMGGTSYERSKKSKVKLDNAAGLFRDEDEPDTVDGALYGPEAAVFVSSEKPLISEIITEGLNPDPKKLTWDNVHWWGVGHERYMEWLTSYESTIGSTPGSYHAIHMHWRWSKYIVEASPGLIDPSHLGEKQFKGAGVNYKLVDPNIENQILRVAIVKNENIPENYHDQKSLQYQDFFINLRNNQMPKYLKDGADIILYYSVEIELGNNKIKKNSAGGLDCAIFVHGLFFAHETEEKTMFSGSTGPMYVNPSFDDVNKDKWERFPSK